MDRLDKEMIMLRGVLSTELVDVIFNCTTQNGRQCRSYKLLFLEPSGMLFTMGNKTANKWMGAGRAGNVRISNRGVIQKLFLPGIMILGILLLNNNFQKTY